MEIDKSNMRQVILDFPKQFRAGLKCAENVKLSGVNGRISGVIVAGLGGSALPGELIKLSNAKLALSDKPIHIHRNYGLPVYATKNSLVVTISYSGNTEETISAYKEAKKGNFPLIAIATGGELQKLCKKNKTPIALIPKTDIQPRAAIGYQFAALVKILSNTGLIKSQDGSLGALEKSLAPSTLEAQGKALAKKISGKTPLIYSSQNYKALSYIWKIKFNENSKTHAFWNYFPELNHNEMVGYADFSQISDLDAKSSTHRSSAERYALPKLRRAKEGRRAPGFYTIILKADDDHPSIKKRMDLMASIIKKRGYSTETIDIKGNEMYNRMFNTILLGDWVSYYLALEYGIDPTPVDIVEEFKKKLK